MLAQREESDTSKRVVDRHNGNLSRHRLVQQTVGLRCESGTSSIERCLSVQDITYIARPRRRLLAKNNNDVILKFVSHTRYTEKV